MNRRQEQLLNTVLKNPGCSVRDLAARLGVSERTIRNDIRDLPGLSGGRKGVVATEAAAKMLEELAVIPQDQDGRILWLVRQVLLEGESPAFDEVCDQLAVSSSTLKADIMLFNRRMEATGCRLRLRQKHIVCTGEERQIRHALRQVIRDSTTDAFVHPSFLKTVFDPDLVDAVERVCTAWLTDHGSGPNDLLRLMLIQYCSLIAARNARAEAVHDGLAGTLEKATGRRLTEEDARACRQLESQVTGAESIGPEIRQFARKVVDHLEFRYAVRLDQSGFLPLFESHLQQLRIRSQKGKCHRNPLTESIRKQSPFVFDMAVDVAGFFETQFGCSLTEDEIAFFALHIGASLALQEETVTVQVVCPAYHGLQETFLRTLESVFPAQMRFQPVDTREICPGLPVISSVPLKTAHLLVAPFPGREDLSRIRQYLQQYSLRQEMVNASRLFSATRFTRFGPDPGPQDAESVIRFLSHQMVLDQLSDASLAERVLARERISGTAFGSFAIPHAMHGHTGRSGIAAPIFPEGLNWNGTRVKAVFLLQMAGESAASFEPFYSRFIRLLQRQDVLDRLVQARDYEAFRQRLAESWTES